MPDDFPQKFQYGLNDLPLEPPDDGIAPGNVEIGGAALLTLSR